MLEEDTLPVLKEVEVSSTDLAIPVERILGLYDHLKRRWH